MDDFVKEVLARGSEKKIVDKDLEYVKWLFELSNKDVPIAGGKGASLAEMYQNKFPVPPAFIITAQCFEKFIESIEEEIKSIINSISVEDTSQLNESSKKVRELIENQKFPEEMEKEILEAYEILGAEKQDVHISGDAMNILRIAKEPVFVAVRSSATTEDLVEASFAGQQETFLNIKGNSKLLSSVKKCFSSLYTPRAIYYRNKQGFKDVRALLSVVVQKMVDSEKSGVMFTKNPVQNDGNVVIEAVFGLGEGIVSGKIHPDNYRVDPELEILEKTVAGKKIALVRNGAGETEEVKLTEERSNQQVLTEGEIKEIANIGLRIEAHYKKPQDIEFALEGGKVYIVQSRPITTLGKEQKKTSKIEGKVLLSGLAASPGVASGGVRIVKSMDDLPKVEKGDILVTEMTNPDMVVTMQKSDAIITDEGGATSHAAIVSREMGIPCVVGTREATLILKDGQIVTVDGAAGKVYEGEVGEEKKKEILPIITGTKTKIKVMVDLPEFAERAAKSKCDSVGLCRLEGIIAGSGKHPIHFVKENRIEAYSEVIRKGVEKIAEHFDSLWIRASDIRSDEFRNLEGSPKEVEMNPMLGFHGIRFSLKNKKILEAELLAIKKVAEKFPIKKLGIMFPQVISVEEAIEAKKEFSKIKTENMEFGVMVETPAAVQIIEDLCDVGLDFISFGTNDLTQYTLAIDRNNEEVQDIYNEMHPAVLKQIGYVIEICKKNGVQTSICGQAGSKPEMAKFLIEQGIDSISVNADAAYDISKLVKGLEEKKGKEEIENSVKESVMSREIDENTKIEQITKEIGEESEEAPDVSQKDIGQGNISEIDNLGSIEEKAEKIKEEVEEGKKQEFPNIDLGIDIFNSQVGQSIEESEGGEKVRDTIIGSIVTNKPPQFPDLDIDFSFLDPPKLSPQLPPPKLSPKLPPKPGINENKNIEQDEELKEVLTEMMGQNDEEDIDMPANEVEDEVLDIF